MKIKTEYLYYPEQAANPRESIILTNEYLPSYPMPVVVFRNNHRKADEMPAGAVILTRQQNHEHGEAIAKAGFVVVVEG